MKKVTPLPVGRRVKFYPVFFEFSGRGLECAPVLFSGDVVGRANPFEDSSDLLGLLELCLVCGLHLCEGISEDLIEIFVSGLMPLLFGFEHGADLAELTGIEPDTGTAGALIYCHLLFDAEEVPHHDDAVTLGAISSFFEVKCYGGVGFDIEQGLAGGFVGFVEFL